MSAAERPWGAGTPGACRFCGSANPAAGWANAAQTVCCARDCLARRPTTPAFERVRIREACTGQARAERPWDAERIAARAMERFFAAIDRDARLLVPILRELRGFGAQA